MQRVLRLPGKAQLVATLSSIGSNRRLVKLGKSQLSSTASLSHERLYQVLPPLESFSRRHIGPSPEDEKKMLETCGVNVSLFASLRESSLWFDVTDFIWASNQVQVSSSANVFGSI